MVTEFEKEAVMGPSFTRMDKYSSMIPMKRRRIQRNQKGCENNIVFDSNGSRVY